MLYFYNIPRDIIKYNNPANIDNKYNITQISDCCRKKYLSIGDKRFNLPQNREVKKYSSVFLGF